MEASASQCMCEAFFRSPLLHTFLSQCMCFSSCFVPC